jgi:Holliday junction resolvase-like predicted endonuclease
LFGLGKKGELLAANYLKAMDYEVLEMNYYNKRGYRFGEIDLISRDKNGIIVFVEVKTREGNLNKVSPEASIDNKKLQNIFKIAHLYLKDQKWAESEWRVDFIGVTFDFQIRKAQLRHIKALYQ